MNKYRYRWNGGTTYGALKRIDRALAKIGKVRYVKGYRYRGRYNAVHEGVLIKGTEGSARFSGFCWGYGGEGPRGLVLLLMKLGIHKERAELIAFGTRRFDGPGMDWIVSFLPQNKVQVLTRERMEEDGIRPILVPANGEEIF